MMAIIIDGKALSESIFARIRDEVSGLDKKPRLDVLLVGNDPASATYVRIKEKTCSDIGIRSVVHRYDSLDEDRALSLIRKLNEDADVNAVLVQLPLKGLDERKIIESVDPKKDVDCLTSTNLGKLFSSDALIQPCTPKGIITILENHDIPVAGKRAVVIGRSLIVGRPVSLLLQDKDATVTMCHSKTRSLKSITSHADILVSAVGKPGLITHDMVKEGSVVIDVGITMAGGRILGDVDFDDVKEKCLAITPVPGGVGPMTIASLMQNTLHCYNLQLNHGYELL